MSQRNDFCVFTHTINIIIKQNFNFNGKSTNIYGLYPKYMDYTQYIWTIPKIWTIPNIYGLYPKYNNKISNILQ